MPSISQDLYKIGPKLAKNQSVEKLIELMQPIYMVVDSSASQYDPEAPIHDTTVLVDEVNSVVMGIWPSEGIVRKLKYGPSSEIDALLESGVLIKEMDYDFDGILRKPMIPFSLSTA